MCQSSALCLMRSAIVAYHVHDVVCDVNDDVAQVPVNLSLLSRQSNALGFWPM